MSRDLILINPDKYLITIRQLTKLMVKDVIQIDY